MVDLLQDAYLVGDLFAARGTAALVLKIGLLNRFDGDKVPSELVLGEIDLAECAFSETLTDSIEVGRGGDGRVQLGEGVVDVGDEELLVGEEGVTQAHLFKSVEFFLCRGKDRSLIILDQLKGHGFLRTLIFLFLVLLQQFYDLFAPNTFISI